MMFSRLPSLTSLRAFEAAARLGSFKRAADELSVTPAAVGAQIRSLETQLGVALFKRHHRRVEPTTSARHLQQACHLAFSNLLEAAEAVAPETSHPTLTIGVGTLFAARWLSPRLSGFWLAHPNIALRLIHAPDLAEIVSADIDGVIAWGNGDWPGVSSDLLFRPHLVPVASPDYLARHGYPKRPADLRNHILVHERDERMWLDWLAAQQVDTVWGGASTTVRDGALALQLAVDGQAIALGVAEFLDKEFASGSLERLFSSDPSGRAGYFLAMPPRYQARPPMRALREWILSEAAASQMRSPSIEAR